MHPDLLVRRIAARQLHLVTRRQALDAGLSGDQIRHRVRTGAFCRVFPGVYLVTGAQPCFEQRAFAASLTTGDGSCVSDIAAAAIWGFAEPSASFIDVTVPEHRHPTGVAGVRVHRRRLNVGIDRTHRGPIPITTPNRTLLDVASQVVFDLLEGICDEAFRRSKVSPERLLDYLARDDLARCRGIASLRSIAADRARHGVPESQLESDALRLFRSYALREPVRQYRTRASGRAVRFDLAYPDMHLAIELDGRAPHWGRDAWQSDHDRHDATELDGWRVLRFTWCDVHDRPLYVVLTVAAALDLRPRGWTSRRSSKLAAR